MYKMYHLEGLLFRQSFPLGHMGVHQEILIIK